MSRIVSRPHAAAKRNRDNDDNDDADDVQNDLSNKNTQPMLLR